MVTVGTASPLPAHPKQGTPLHARRRSRNPLAQSQTAQALALASLIGLSNLAWTIRDNTTPSWDQSHFLYLTWVYQHALDHHGIAAFVRAVYRTDPGRAPLFSVFMMPFTYILGQGPGAGLALNTVLWVVLALSAGGVAKEFGGVRGHKARLLTMVIIAPMPELVWLSHTVLEDFLLATLTTLAVWVLLKTEQFERRSASAVFGLLLAIGTLSKLSFAVAIAGPLLVFVTFALLARWPDRVNSGYWRAYGTFLINSALVLALWAFPSLLWYVPNWAATRAYLHLTFEQQPGTELHPLALANLKTFANSLISFVSWWTFGLAVIVLIGGLISLFRVLRTRSNLPDHAYAIAFLGSWCAIPVLAVAISTNQDPRYSVAAYPAGGVIVAVVSMNWQWSALRKVIATVAVAVGLAATLQVNVASFRVPGLPSMISFRYPLGTAYIPTTAYGGVSGGLPKSTNSAVALMKTLESLSRTPDGRVRHESIALLGLNSWLNGNNLPYYSLVRNDPFTFVTLLDVPSSQLGSDLAKYDFAIYTPPPPASLDSVDGRVAQLNATAASGEMTPADFALFYPNPRRLTIPPDAGQPPYAEVLVRRVEAPRT
jgi:4-amino-4-deoxy-L-arabinose transferase-like glycosyltransferase